MRITPQKITVRELMDGYEESLDDCVFRWGGKLDTLTHMQVVVACMVGKRLTYKDLIA